MIKCAVQLIYGAGAESISYFGAVKGDTNGWQIAQDFTRFVAFYLAVVGDVLKVFKTFHHTPLVGVENVRNFFGKLNSHSNNSTYRVFTAWTAASNSVSISALGL